MPGWKSVQSKKKLKQKTRLALGILGFIIVLLLLAQIFKGFKALTSSWQMDSKKNYTWDSQFNINLLFRSKNLSLVSYNPSLGKVIIADIPDETYIEASNGFGKWQARALFDLGGIKILKVTMQDFFALPVDGFLDFSGEFKDKSARQLLDTLRGGPLAGVNMLPFLKTDLTLFELIRFKMGLNLVRFDKIKEIDLKKGVLQKDKLPDGTEILTADPNKLDVALADLIDPAIKNEHKNIVILNSTEKPFFAQKWARLVTNIGGDVIITSNAQRKIDKTAVAGEPSKTLTRLMQIFNSCRDCDKIIKSDEDFATSRGQITVKLAPDLN